ncbi:hypothetical protein HGM15179_020609, partial [Zosterops borbonicus]
DPLGFGDPPQDGPGEAQGRLSPPLWSPLPTGAPPKPLAPGQPWIEPLPPFEDAASPEPSPSDSGVELSGDSGACSQRSSPDGGLAPPTPGMAPPTPGLAPPTPGLAPPTPGLVPPTPGLAPPTSSLPAPGLAPPTPAMAPPTSSLAPPTPGLATPTPTVATPPKPPPGGAPEAPPEGRSRLPRPRQEPQVCGAPPVAPPGPIGTERSQRTRNPPELWGPPQGHDGDPRPRERGEGLPPPSGGSDGLSAAPRDWDLLPGGAPETPPNRPPDPKGPPRDPPRDPPGPGQRQVPEICYGGATTPGQVPPPAVEPPPGSSSGSFRPGTPSMTPYRPVLVAGAGLPLPPLKGPFLDFPELAKLGGPGGVLYPPPPFLYGPFCPDPPVLQVRQELTPPSEFYGQGQSSFQQ